MPYMPQDSLPFPKNPVHDCEPPKLTIPVPRGKHIVIQIVPDEPYVLRIDGVLVSTEVLLTTLRPDADPRKWFRFERTPSPSHPEEDIITVHTETREA